MHLRNSMTRSTSFCWMRQGSLLERSFSLGVNGGMSLLTWKFQLTSVTRSLITGKAFIGPTLSWDPYSAIGVLHMRREKPSISAEHEPHLAALQFQRTARSDAALACTHSTASRTTMPSRTGTR